ncbi:MAG TPA: protein kinase [Pirellulales bacterium]|nr:protein kinase [Pirellulales bacterium]
MSKSLSCPNGHVWQAAEPPGALADAPRPCPVCGIDGLVASALASPNAADDEDDWPPSPRRLSEPDGKAFDPVPCRAAEEIRPLSNCDAFSTLPDILVRLVESRLRRVAFAPGETIMREGEAGECLLVIGEGTVEISTRDENGPRHLINRAGPGAVLGEMALLAREPRTADVVAVTEVLGMVLSAVEFHELARRYPPLAFVLTNLIAARLGGERRDVLFGKTLQGYRILRRLGKGGMGVVYEAEETATGLHRALKMLNHRLVYDTVALAQFQREADLTESLQHENIVRVHGRFAAFHTYFIVMQFCDGEPLNDLIARHGRMAEVECRKILGQLARALVCAHAAGVIHRDVKPSNILVNRDGTVKLTDFGLARPVVDHDSILCDLVVGSPQYMAPEQMLGRGVDARADYFGLGCVGFELITGVPVSAESSFGKLRQQRIEWQVPDVRRWRRGISKPLLRLLRQCLERDPERRSPEMETLVGWAAPVDTALLRVPTG